MGSVASYGVAEFTHHAASTPSGRTQVPSLSQNAGGTLSAEGILDSDRDLLPDAVENFVYGTDPQRWSTSGSGIPDSWLVSHGFDPLDPAVGATTGATPPPGALPSAHRGIWPPEFAVTLLEAYNWQRPVDWNESTSGPYEGGLDPRSWDSNNDSIPDGWLLHYGLDPRTEGVGQQRLAGPDGLTVAEAFQYNTDPRRLDTDGDGLSDRQEVDGSANPRFPTGPARFPPTDPNAYSTTQTGVCDGYLVAHGLDPGVSSNSLSDLTRSGATVLEKFTWSKARFKEETCTAGRGLDPTRQSTLGGPIPDGWLLRYGLDPLDPATPNRVTQTTDDSQGVATQAPDLPALAGVTLTVLDEYKFGRPPSWNEAERGPWQNGTDPTKSDTDGDGMDDASELRGYYVQWSTDVGPNPGVRFSRTMSDPTLADSDADGLTDFEEVHTFHTDPSRQDTDSDGIPDGVETASTLHLNATRADTPGDYMRDGERLRVLQSRADAYALNPAYEFPGEPGKSRSVADWLAGMPGAKGFSTPLSSTTIRALVGPTGDVDGDGVPNILDIDIDGDGIANGLEIDPTLYTHSQFGPGRLPRPATDPLNPDTDGDQLLDGWEVQYGQPRFDVSPARYSLDPSRWDSDGNGVSDAQEDPDHDSLKWTDFQLVGGVVVATPREFGFPNLLEQQFRTDPTRFDSDADALGDGWKVFWGLVYPDIPAVGPRPMVGIPQAQVIVASNPYDRFVLDPTALLPGETVAQTFSGIPVPQGGQRTVYKVHGILDWGFRQVHDLGTNPYRIDTSLDGIPDWWAYLHRAPRTAALGGPGQCVAGALTPLVSYGPNDDPDADRQDDLAEFRQGTDPLCADSDMDGLADGEEIHLGLNPADPSDGQRVLDENTDGDGDGIPGFRELVGQQRPGLSGLVRTDPDTPDSDGDGLADGPQVPRDGAFPESDPWARLLTDMGIVYAAQGSGTQRSFTFQGEDASGTDPRVFDDSGTGVPAGWLVAHNLPATLSSPSYADQYAFARPAWWNERIDGPWWGGLAPDASVADARGNPDLDRDGLQDADGSAGFEDPLPFVNHANALRPIDWSQYPAALGIVAPPAGSLPNDGSLAPLVQRLLAQAYLNPRAVGATSVQPAPSQPIPAQRQPCMDIDRLVDANGATINALSKGETGFLLGRIQDCAGTGYFGVTVEARAGNPSQVFGATFTGPDGRFTLPINISGSHSVGLPANGAAILRGRTAGTVNWTADPSVLSTGANRFLTIRSYASPNAAPWTNYRPALASAIQSLSVTIRSQSILTLSAPNVVVTGSGFKVEFKLSDSGGSPLRDPVQFNWSGSTFPVVMPDTKGQGSINLPASADQAGRRTLSARSLPSASQSAFVQPAEATKDVLLRRPVDILITSSPTSADAGQVVFVKGRVVFKNAGVKGANVVVNLTGGTQLLTQATALTGSDGTFSVGLSVPSTVGRGDYTIVATALPTDLSIQEETSALLSLRSNPRFAEVSLGDVRQGTPVPISGKLAEPDGQGIADASIQVSVWGAEANVTTDANGRFDVTLAPDLPAHPVRQSLRFAGDASHTAAQSDGERSIVADSKLVVTSGAIARGENVDVDISLTDASGAPLVGAPVNVTWGHEPTSALLTDAMGHAALSRRGNASDPLGNVIVRASYLGSADGTILGSRAAGTWRIMAAAEFVLPSGVFDAGTSIPEGLLRDAGTHAPLTNQRVDVTADGILTSLATDADGSFPVVSGSSRGSAPSVAEVKVSFPGNELYPTLSASTRVIIHALTHLGVDAPSTLVVGQPGLAQVAVTDLGGRPVPDGAVRARVGDTVLGVGNVSDGRAVVPVVFAANETAGSRAIVWEFVGSDQYGGSTNETRIHLLDRVVLVPKLQPAEAGQRATMIVTATRGGHPVADAPIFLDLAGPEGSVQALTDSSGVARFEIIQPDTTALASIRYAGETDVLPAHTTVALAPLQPIPVLEQATRSVSWVALAVALGLMVLVFVASRIRRSPLEPIARRVRRILAARGPDARQILRAYLALQEAAIGFGLLPDVANTARTLQEALRPRLPLDAGDALERLIGLFEKARYSTETIDGGHRAEALAALDEILLALRRQSVFEWNQAAEPEWEATG